MMPLGISIWLGLAGAAYGAAPANDNFASAEVIPVGFNDWGTVNGDNTDATAEHVSGIYRWLDKPIQ